MKKLFTWFLAATLFVCASSGTQAATFEFETESFQARMQPQSRILDFFLDNDGEPRSKGKDKGKKRDGGKKKKPDPTPRPRKPGPRDEPERNDD